MKKYNKTSELTNSFPQWAKIRDDQSVGFSLFNVLGKQIEILDKELERIKRNQYLPTFNLDEIDLIYKVELPTNVSFSQDLTNPLHPSYVNPTLQGFVVNTTVSGYVDVAIAEDNDIKSFWYDSLPNRVTHEETASGEFILLTLTGDEVTWSGELTHHLADDTSGGGNIWIEVADGTPYIRKNDTLNIIERTQVRLEGVTRKGTIDEETFAFGWDEKQKSLKEWRRIKKLDISNATSGITIQLRSADFNQGPYWSFWNNRVSENKKKIDEFWDLGTAEAGNSTLEYISHMTDDYRLLIQGFDEKEAKKSWELLDESNNTLTLVDLAVQPFSDKIWTVTSGGMLYCFDSQEDMIDDFILLKDKTVESYVQLDFDYRDILLGEDFIFRPLQKRIVQDLLEFRVWWQDPNGTQYHHTDAYWEAPKQQARVITDDITVTPVIRGEWLFVVESRFQDGTIHTDKAIGRVMYKTPLVTLDLSAIVALPIVGIDFDTDQQLWVLTNDDLYHRIGLHTDIALIDFDNKILYFKENYTDVKVTI
jgi:hypothetical protein